MRRAVVALSLVLAACTNAVKADLDAYVHAGLPTLIAYEIRLQDDAKNPHDMVKQARAYVKAAESIHPTTTPIRALHDLKLHAARSQAAALVDFEAALNKRNRALGNRARSRFRAARAEYGAFDAKLAELKRSYGVRN